MTTPLRPHRPGGGPAPFVVPPQPTSRPEVPEPAAPVAPAGAVREKPRDRADRGERADRRRQTIHKTRSRTTNRSRRRDININFTKNIGAGATIGQTGGSSASEMGTPGAGFMTNEDIRAFSEHLRKEGRNRAVERSMDAEHLQAVLKNIPTAEGSMAGARMRARRVARHLKAIAAAEKLIARQAAALYSTFEAQFESDLRKVGKARDNKKRPDHSFKFS